MNTKLLKQKILDLAIRGKLTQQLKSDGTALDLLKQISEQKRESSSTLSSPRRRGSSSAQSEKTIIPLDKNEAPFEIPANWEWVRLGDVCDDIFAGGDKPLVCTKEKTESNLIPVYANGIENDGLYGFTNVARVTKKAITISARGTIGFSCVRELPFVPIVRLLTVIPFYHLVDLKYLKAVFDILLNVGEGSSIPQLTVPTIRIFVFPLPPLAEQQRIVEKIQEAFAEIDSIENNKELLKTHIKQARQKILDLAIHGKLVLQNKADEPASVLLERITRDNPHYEKLTDVPFEIPDSWKWVKLGDVCKPIKRGKSPKYIEQSNILVFAQKCNQKDGPVSLEKALYLDESTLNKYPKEEFLQKGDVIINSTGTGTLGRVGHFNVDLPQGIKGIVPDSHVTTIRSSVVNSNYLYSYLKNKQSYLEKNGEGSTNQKELKPHTIYDLEFPLPPLAEQKRIVNKIEEIFASLDDISLHLV